MLPTTATCCMECSCSVSLAETKSETTFEPGYHLSHRGNRRWPVFGIQQTTVICEIDPSSKRFQRCKGAAHAAGECGATGAGQAGSGRGCPARSPGDFSPPMGSQNMAASMWQDQGTLPGEDCVMIQVRGDAGPTWRLCLFPGRFGFPLGRCWRRAVWLGKAQGSLFILGRADVLPNSGSRRTSRGEQPRGPWCSEQKEAQRGGCWHPEHEERRVCASAPAGTPWAVVSAAGSLGRAVLKPR